MQTLRPVDPSTSTGAAKDLFAVLEQRLKRIPNMIRLMANSPAILDAYLRFNLVAGTEVDFPLVSTNADGRETLVSSHVN